MAALGVLSVMTLLATMSLMAGGADLIDFDAAGPGALRLLCRGVGAGDDDGGTRLGWRPVPEASLHAPWPAPGIAVRRWQDGEWAAARRICLIPDVGDADGDPATTVVLFDRSFGHAASPLPRGGYPVLQVLVTAQGGESRQAIVAEVAPVTCAPAITAAWTAAGPLDLSGDIRVAGAAALPALAAGGPVRLFDGAVVEGELALDPRRRCPPRCSQILNAGGTLARLEDLPEPLPDGNLDGLFWSRGDYSGPLDGRGILHRAQSGVRPREARGIAASRSRRACLARGMTRPTPTSTRPGSPRDWKSPAAGRSAG